MAVSITTEKNICCVEGIPEIPGEKVELYLTYRDGRLVSVDMMTSEGNRLFLDALKARVLFRMIKDLPHDVLVDLGLGKKCVFKAG